VLWSHFRAASGEPPIRFLMVSEVRSPEVIVYPDSDKVGARDWEVTDGLRMNWRASDAVDYWEGEG
jgi:uncharacterized cupin superfamily protein